MAATKMRIPDVKTIYENLKKKFTKKKKKVDKTSQVMELNAAMNAVA